MKLTNYLNLPQPIAAAVANDDYSRGAADFSVTQLLAPPRKVALEAQHEQEITEDVSDRIFSLLGQSIHTILERAGDGRREERLTADFGGVTVSGQFDYFDSDDAIWDWKVASVYEITHGVQKEKEQQVNCYRLLAVRNGYEVSGLRLGFILRDWSRTQTVKANYPPHQVVVYPVTMWSLEETERFIAERIRLHLEARSVLPLCTDEERWAGPPRWALMKRGNKRASKVFDTKWEAEEAVKIGYYVEERPGTNTRCEFYCAAAPFCDQWKALNV